MPAIIGAFIGAFVVVRLLKRKKRNRAQDANEGPPSPWSAEPDAGSGGPSSSSDQA